MALTGNIDRARSRIFPQEARSCTITKLSYNKELPLSHNSKRAKLPYLRRLKNRL
ncbi:MAG: hypothetical protein ACRCT1_13935 [Microcoleaceae cyanobacterium]